MITIVQTVIAVAAAACTAIDYVVPSPVGGGSSGGDANDTTEVVVDTVEKSMAERYPAPVGAAGALVADGVTDTYALMNSCGYYEECPDSSGTHAAAHVRHITQVKDEELERPVFKFDIHIDIDDDRGKPEITDRQRVEIKTYAASPDNMVGAEGQTHTYTWKFRLPEGFKATSKFCHIHQLKGYGGSDIGNPLITLTARLKSGRQYLQLLHYGSGGAASEVLEQISLDALCGEWVMVTECATFTHNGSYSIRIVRMRDDKTLLEYSSKDTDLWRIGATAIRPKWGIYRSFGAGGSLKSQMRDESLLFADFTLEER